MRDKTAIITAGLALMFAVAAGLLAAGADGKKIFDTKCASCHGKDGKGNPSMAKMFKVAPEELNLVAGVVGDDTDDEMLAIINKGKGKMPAYEKQLTVEERNAVVTYLLSLAPKKEEPKKAEAPPAKEEPAVKKEEVKEAAVPAEPAKAPEAAKKEETPAAPAVKVSDAAKADYAKSCASCHGKDGKGNAAMANVFKVAAAALDLVDADTLGKSDADLSKVTADGLNKMPAYKSKLTDAQIADIVAYIRSLK